MRSISKNDSRRFAAEPAVRGHFHRKGGNRHGILSACVPLFETKKSKDNPVVFCAAHCEQHDTKHKRNSPCNG